MATRKQSAEEPGTGGKAAVRILFLVVLGRRPTTVYIASDHRGGGVGPRKGRPSGPSPGAIAINNTREWPTRHEEKDKARRASTRLIRTKEGQTGFFLQLGHYAPSSLQAPARLTIPGAKHNVHGASPGLS